MRYEKSRLHLTITKQEKIISALEREVAALKSAMDLESHRSSQRRSSTTKGKKAVLEDELKVFRSVVFAMEKDLSFNVDQETKELTIVDSEDDNTDETRCWIGRGDLVNFGAGLVQGPDASVKPEVGAASTEWMPVAVRHPGVHFFNPICNGVSRVCHVTSRL